MKNYYIIIAIDHKIVGVADVGKNDVNFEGAYILKFQIKEKREEKKKKRKEK